MEKTILIADIFGWLSLNVYRANKKIGKKKMVYLKNKFNINKLIDENDKINNE